MSNGWIEGKRERGTVEGYSEKKERRKEGGREGWREGGGMTCLPDRTGDNHRLSTWQGMPGLLHLEQGGSGRSK